MLLLGNLNAEKRIWIYAGLAVVAGVGLTLAVSSKDTPAKGSGSPGGPAMPPGSPGTTFTPLRRGDSVLLVGDSLAQGLTAPMGQLASDSGVTFRGDGRVSTTIQQWAGQPWLDQDLAANPSWVLVSLGTNDMKLLNPSTEQPALSALVLKLKSLPLNLIWVTPPTMPFSDNGVRAMLAGTGATLFQSENLSIPRGPDKIHPTVAGYAGWAGAIWQFMLRGGATLMNERFVINPC